jgi:PAS domain S-box-containing protein
MSFINNTHSHNLMRTIHIPLLVLIISLSITLWGWQTVKTNATQVNFEQFELRAERLKFAIQSRMIAYEHVLRGGESLFASMPSVTRQDWHNYVANLNTHEYFPGIRAMGFSQRVLAADKTAHLHQIRAEGFPNYTIHPSGERDEYIPLVYLEPWETKYEKVLGYDAYADPIRQATAEHARDTGKATITRKLTLVTDHETDTRPAFVMYLPIYRSGQPLQTVADRRSALRGFVTSGFFVEEVIQSLFGKGTELDIDFQIFDGTTTDPDQLIYDEPTENDLWNNYKPQFTKDISLTNDEHTWTLRILTLPKFDATNRKQVPDFILLGGLFISVLLAGLTGSLTIARRINTQLQTEISQRQSIEEKLRNREELLWLVIDSIPQYIVWKDLQSVYLGCNRRFALMAGMNSPTQIIGKTDFDLPWEDQDTHLFRTTDRQVIESDQPEYHIIETFQNQQGQSRWIDTSRIPLHDANGEVMGILITFEDITTQKEAENDLQRSREALQQANVELNQFKTTLDMTLDGVIIRDARTHKVTYVNQGMTNLLGYTQAEFMQLLLNEVNPDITEEKWSMLVNELCNNLHKSKTFETSHRHKNGSLIPVEISLQYIEVPGQTSRFIAMVRNITERKQTEAALLQAKEAAEIANRAKSTFLANMSHELRTPLNGILGYAQILNRDKTLTEKQRDGIRIIERSGDYLLTLINDVLDLSKIEADRVELYPLDFHFGDFLQGITDLFKMRAQQKEIAFNYEPLSPLPTGVRADEKRLRQILINLIGNAVKFTPKGGVTLKIGHHLGQLRFQVEDTGTGIAPEDLTKVFLPFQQVGDPSYRAEGTGLGLSITKKLVEMMGGELHVESTLGHGSTFWFAIDLPESTVVKSKHQEQPVIIGFEGPPRQIIVTDDKWENRSVLVNLLTPLGFEVIEASNGQDCLDKLQQIHPDLILTDLVMPVMDGFEAARHIRKMPEFDQVPIIAASASVFDLDQRQSLEAGCNAFIPKPIRVEILLELLQKHLGLTWIYEQTPSLADTTSEEITSQEAHLIGPAPEQAAELYDLAMMGDIAGIIEYTTQLELADKQLVPFAKKIRQLNKEFDVRQIAEIVERYK